jgi:hypothetical protein
MKALRLLMCFVPLLALLAGCHPFRHLTYACHKPQVYMHATSIPSLKVPTGLDAPDTTNALHLPPLNEPAPPQRKGREPCLDEPPPFKVAKTPQA